MNSLGPLFIVFGFFLALFAVGKVFQKREREKRRLEKATAEAKMVMESLRTGPQEQREAGLLSSLRGVGQEPRDLSRYN